MYAGPICNLYTGTVSMHCFLDQKLRFRKMTIWAVPSLKCLHSNKLFLFSEICITMMYHFVMKESQTLDYIISEESGFIAIYC